MSKENEKIESPEKQLTKEDLRAYLADIEKKVVESNDTCLHSVIALNELLRLPNAEQVLDEELKQQMKDLWIKLKSAGLQLRDPPILFGLPEGFGVETEEVVKELEEDAVVSGRPDEPRKHDA